MASANAKLLNVKPTGPDFVSDGYHPLKDDELVQLRVIGHKNLCVLGLLLFLKYLQHAWEFTYHEFMGPEHGPQISNQFRSHCVLAVHSQVCGLLLTLLKMVKGKQDVNLSNQHLETDPIFDSDVLRMYIWDLIMVYDEYVRGIEIGQSDNATLIEEFTSNIYRDRPGLRGFFSQPRMREALTNVYGESTIPWSKNYEVDRWEFVRHRARLENREPVYSNPDLLIDMRAIYHAAGALDIEPSFRNRARYSSYIEMQNLRRADGIWDFDEPFHNDEVDVFRMFMLWKVGNWSGLTMQRPPAAFFPPIGSNPRIIPIELSSINAGGRDAIQFQPYRPPPPAKKTKDPAKVKDKSTIGVLKPAADHKSKSERQKKKTPLNLDPPPVNEHSDQHDEREYEQWDIFQLDSSEPTRSVTLSSKIPKKTVESEVVGSKVPAPKLHSSDLGDSMHNHLYEVINLRQRVQVQERLVVDLQAQLAQAQTELTATRTRTELQRESQQEWERINARTTSVERAMDSLNTNLSNITREHTNSGNQLYEVIGIMEEKFKGVLDNFVKKSQRVLDAVAQAHSNTAGVPVTHDRSAKTKKTVTIAQSTSSSATVTQPLTSASIPQHPPLQPRQDPRNLLVPPTRPLPLTGFQRFQPL